MDGNVLQQTIPNFSASPGMFFKVLAIITVVIILIALQQKLIFLPLQRILELLKVALRALSRGLRWLCRIKAGVTDSLKRFGRTSAPEDVETYHMPRLRRFQLLGRRTMTLGALGDEESLTYPRRAMLPGRHLRSNTN